MRLPFDTYGFHNIKHIPRYLMPWKLDSMFHKSLKLYNGKVKKLMQRTSYIFSTF